MDFTVRTPPAWKLWPAEPQEGNDGAWSGYGAVVLGVVLTTTSFAAAAPPLVPVRAVAETASNFDDEAGGDADADDPAIWVHPTRPADSVVVGALKNGGLTVVDLRGRELQHIAPPPGGRFNNVDVTGNLAVVSDRGLDRIRIYAINPKGARAATVLTDVTTAAPPLVFSADEAEVAEQRTAYGLAVWADPAGGRRGWWSAGGTRRAWGSSG